MFTSRLSRRVTLTKAFLAATLVLASVAITAQAADAADVGSNDSVNVYGRTTDFIDHDLDTVVTLDRNKLGALGSTTIDWSRSSIDSVEAIEWDRTLYAAKRLKQATGWDLTNPNLRTRLINELKTVSRAYDNEVGRGSKGKLNLPKEQATANLLFTAVRKSATTTDCRGRCLRYTYRSVFLTTIFTLLGASAGAGFFGASLPIVIGVSTAAAILAYVMDTFFQMRNAQAALRREIQNRRESAQAQHYINAFLLEAAEEGIRLGTAQMRAQLDAMAAQINRVEASVTANSQVDLRP